MGSVKNVSLQNGFDDDSADFLCDCAGQTSLCPSFLPHSFSHESHSKTLRTDGSNKLRKHLSIASSLASELLL